MKIPRLIISLFLVYSVFGQLSYCAMASATSEEVTRANDPEALLKINTVVQEIYDGIIAAKPKFKELATFGEKNLTKNEGGFLTITYETEVPSSGGTTFPYKFKLDVEPIKAKTYVSHNGYFNYTMPLLDLQFSGYMIKHPLRRQFDIKTLLDQFAEVMADYQQQFMPLRFMILPEKDTYQVREPIRFKVILANVSAHNILVKGLGESSLYFTLNRDVWGTQSGDVKMVESLTPFQQAIRDQEAVAQQLRSMFGGQSQGETTVVGKRTKVGDQTILRANEALTIDFVGAGYKKAQDVEIRGIYQLNIKGLRPTGHTTLKIVE
ncbi:MAG: hypothetical protein H6754_00690 [Candidatus Omnitrophica bacterium]|nr:hypothetical protein [Candidatus Omnitrophota bacterium]